MGCLLLVLFCISIYDCFPDTGMESPAHRVWAFTARNGLWQDTASNVPYKIKDISAYVNEFDLTARSA
jgi:hypothetical protein